MNGVPELPILRLLQDQEMYGYEIVQAIRERSNDAITAGEGVVYPVLHGLEREGLLSLCFRRFPTLPGVGAGEQWPNPIHKTDLLNSAFRL